MALPAICLSRGSCSEIAVPQVRRNTLSACEADKVKAVSKVHGLIEEPSRLLTIGVEDRGVLLEFDAAGEGRVKPTRRNLRVVAE